MIGLAERGAPSSASSCAPAWGRAFVGIVGEGALEVAPTGAARRSTSRRAPTLRERAIVVSRSRSNARDRAARWPPPGPRSRAARERRGEGGARRVRGGRRRTCSPGRPGSSGTRARREALVRAAGGECTDDRRAPLRVRRAASSLNARGLLATNGRMHAALVEALRSRLRSREARRARPRGHRHRRRRHHGPVDRVPPGARSA